MTAWNSIGVIGKRSFQYEPFFLCEFDTLRDQISLGGSILIYAIHRHHPNPRVGYYTQHAAYRFYSVMGAIIPVGTFFPGRGITPWLIAWGLGLAVIVPWSLWSIARIRREEWPDIELPETNAPAEES